MAATELEATPCIAFLPWLTLPDRARIRDYIFQPMSTSSIADTLGPELGPWTARVAGSYVTPDGSPIQNWTMISRVDGIWTFTGANIPDLGTACELLALATLAAQEFLSNGPYINARVFQAIYKFVVGPEGGASIVLRRVGGSLLSGYSRGMRRYQAPPNVEGVSSPQPDSSFLASLGRAWEEGAPCFGRLTDALPFWLLANSDEPDLFLPRDAPAALALSAIAFDRLLGRRQNARDLSQAFAEGFGGFCKLTLEEAKCLEGSRHVEPDPKYTDTQLVWRVCQKWIKELYELRSRVLHGNNHAKGLSR